MENIARSGACWFRFEDRKIQCDSIEYKEDATNATSWHTTRIQNNSFLFWLWMYLDKFYHYLDGAIVNGIMLASLIYNLKHSWGNEKLSACCWITIPRVLSNMVCWKLFFCD